MAAVAAVCRAVWEVPYHTLSPTARSKQEPRQESSAAARVGLNPSAARISSLRSGVLAEAYIET